MFSKTLSQLCYALWQARLSRSHLHSAITGLRCVMMTTDLTLVAHGEKATTRKWEMIKQRAGELALNHGKRAEDADATEYRRAKRELLGLQTLPEPDDPLNPISSTDHTIPSHPAAL